MIFLTFLSFFVSCVLSATTVGTVIGGPHHPRDITDVEYDAIIVGGGPAGLSALSGLARVRRHVLLIDSGEYRNGDTRHMHDVIGLDGVTPAYFRWLAREKIAYYNTVSWTNGTVTDIEPQATGSRNPSYTVNVTYPTGEEAVLAARSVVLATGLVDLIPDTPGLRESWAEGIYWCPWCDGYEHADQALGLLGGLAAIPGMAREILTLDTDLVAFVNGTDTPAARGAADSAFPGWETFLAENNVTVYNQTLVSITRLADGGAAGGDPSAPTHPEYDLFRVDLDDGTSVERAAFLAGFPDTQRSNLGRDLGVLVQDDRLAGVQSQGYLTNVPLVYAVGDITIDQSTNVPHAMYSGKKAAVSLHIALARQEAAAQIAAAGEDASPAAKRIAEPELDPREVWEVMNGPRGDILHAGDFDGFGY